MHYLSLLIRALRRITEQLNQPGTGHRDQHRNQLAVCLCWFFDLTVSKHRAEKDNPSYDEKCVSSLAVDQTCLTLPEAFPAVYGALLCACVDLRCYILKSSFKDLSEPLTCSSSIYGINTRMETLPPVAEPAQKTHCSCLSRLPVQSQSRGTSPE